MGIVGMAVANNQFEVDNIQMDANLDDSRDNILLIYSSFVCSIFCLGEFTPTYYHPM